MPKLAKIIKPRNMFELSYSYYPIHLRPYKSQRWNYKIGDMVILLDYEYEGSYRYFMPLIPYIKGEIPRRAINWKYHNFEIIHKDSVEVLNDGNFKDFTLV